MSLHVHVQVKVRVIDLLCVYVLLCTCMCGAPPEDIQRGALQRCSRRSTSPGALVFYTSRAVHNHNSMTNTCGF